VRYYVYEHYDPDTDEIVYVGMGSLGRAWSFADTGTAARRGNRPPEHATWAYALCDRGISPEDFVRVTDSGLSREDALALERDRILELGYPKFNKPPGPHLKNRNQWGEWTAASCEG